MPYHIGFYRDSIANSDIIQNLPQRPSSLSHNTAFFFFLQYLTVGNAEKLQMRSLAESIFYHTLVRENPLVDLFLSYIFTWADKI